MSFRILGPIQAVADGCELPLGGRRQLALLTFLLLNANRAVSSDVLTEAVWGPVRAADNRLPMAIVRLRKVLRPLDPPDGRRLRTVGGGYLLTLQRYESDVELFEARARAGRTALDSRRPGEAIEYLDSALALWRGPPLAEVAFEDFAQPEIRRLEELHLMALESRADARLQLGQDRELIGELEALLTKHPTREHLAAQLMLALYRCGRQADALDTYQRTRRHLASDLGLEPGPALTGLQAQILTQDEGLQTEAGPRARVTSRPVPLPPTETIGREREIEAVCRALREPHTRLFTLVGPGGVGKTRLALEVAHALQATMPDGVCWIELAGVARPEDVGAAMVRALAMAPAPGETPTESLLRFLASKRMLLVADNFEHLLPAAELLAEIVSMCGGLKILTTSREALNLSAEHRLSVPPLELPPASGAVSVSEIESTAATALFLDAAHRRDSGLVVTPATAGWIASICARLDGLPLAIELAAARLELFGIEMLAARLASLSVLGTGPRDSPPRHRTLAATVDWSVGLLDSEQRSAFIRFAAFAGSAELDDAEAVTGANLETLHALISKHLLTRRVTADGSSRLVILETLRQYASERLAEDPGQDGVCRRHFERYLHLLERAVPLFYTHSDAQAMAMIERDIDNIDLALRWAIVHEPLGALRIVGLFGEYWWLSGESGGLELLDAALEAAGEQAPLENRAHAQVMRNFQLAMAGRYHEAHDAAAAALDMYERAGDDRGASFAALALAVGNDWLGDADGNRAMTAKACQLARSVGDRGLLGQVLAIHASGLPADQRQAAFEEAVALLTEVGDDRYLTAIYTNFGDMALQEGRFGEALEFLELAHAAGRKGTNPWMQMGLVDTFALANLITGDTARARDLYASELELGANHGFYTTADSMLAGVGALAVTEDDGERAARLLGAARTFGHPRPGQHAAADRLERDFFAPARDRYGHDAWRRAERRGGAMSRDDALSYARESLAGVARLEQRRRRMQRGGLS